MKTQTVIVGLCAVLLVINQAASRHENKDAKEKFAAKLRLLNKNGQDYTNQFFGSDGPKRPEDVINNNYVQRPTKQGNGEELGVAQNISDLNNEDQSNSENQNNQANPIAVARKGGILKAAKRNYLKTGRDNAGSANQDNGEQANQEVNDLNNEDQSNSENQDNQANPIAVARKGILKAAKRNF